MRRRFGAQNEVLEGGSEGDKDFLVWLVDPENLKKLAVSEDREERVHKVGGGIAQRQVEESKPQR